MPYRIHIILNRIGIPFAEQPLTKANHPWINGKVDKMNRTIKVYHYDSHDQLCRHLANFFAARNFAGGFKTLRGSHPARASRSKQMQPNCLVKRMLNQALLHAAMLCGVEMPNASFDPVLTLWA